MDFPEQTSEFINDLTNNEIQNIYNLLSVSDDIYFDTKNENAFLVEEIQEVFDVSFRSIETKQLQSETMLININIACLIKHLVNEHKFKNIGLIFINFCDYFDLDYNKTYSQLQDKLKNLIEISAKNMIGQKKFTKYKNKVNPNQGIKITSLFDLVKK